MQTQKTFRIRKIFSLSFVTDALEPNQRNPSILPFRESNIFLSIDLIYFFKFKSMIFYNNHTVELIFFKTLVNQQTPVYRNNLKVLKLIMHPGKYYPEKYKLMRKPS